MVLPWPPLPPTHPAHLPTKILDAFKEKMQAGAGRETVATPWNPALPVERTSSVKDIVTALTFGSSDAASWGKIRGRFETRGIETVENITEHWDIGELTSVIHGAKPAKHARTYLKAIGHAIEHDFYKHLEFKAKPEPAEGQRGDWMLKCSKIKPDASFKASDYMPDGRVFAALPKKDSADHMDKDEGELASDLLWLDAHANPEAAIGDYLPEGVPARIGKICTDMLPPFQPTRDGEARPPARIATLRHQNARDAKKPYVRMVLSNEFEEYIGTKSRGSVTFVEPGSAQLLENVRNDLMSDLVKVYRTKSLAPMAVKLPSKTIEKAPEPNPGHMEVVEGDGLDADIRINGNEGDGLDALDGAVMPGGGHALPPPLPKGQGNSSGAGGASSKSKKHREKAKSAKAAGPPPRQPQPYGTQE